MSQGSILVIEDDQRIQRFVRSALTLEGYEVLAAVNGREGLDIASDTGPNLIILDIGLPVMDGWEFLEKLREFSQVPVIILSARGEDIDKVRGLKMGADDYLSKPFNPDELLARVEAVMRRTRESVVSPQSVVQVEDLEIDLKNHSVVSGERKEGITRLEGRLLAYFIQNSGRVMTNEELLSKVWGPEYQNDVQILRTAVNRIRKKLAVSPIGPKLIKNVPGVGYAFQPEP